MTNKPKNAWARALEDAQRKAEELSEDEINARLGPATRRFFDAAEKLEHIGPHLFDGTKRTILATLGLALAGWTMGRLTTYLHFPPPHIIFILAGLTFAFSFWATATTRRKGGDIPYSAAIIGFLACSATGKDTETSAAIGFFFIAGVGLAQICVRRKPPQIDLDTPTTPLNNEKHPTSTQNTTNPEKTTQPPADNKNGASQTQAPSRHLPFSIHHTTNSQRS